MMARWDIHDARAVQRGPAPVGDGRQEDILDLEPRSAGWTGDGGRLWSS
jgi:hypothetical protein